MRTDLRNATPATAGRSNSDEPVNARHEVRVDAYTRVCLTVIAVLLTVLIIGLWAQETPSAPRAHAGMPTVLNPQAQRYAAPEAVQETNNKLGQLISLFQSGNAKVTIAGGLEGQAAKSNGSKTGKGRNAPRSVPIR